MDRFTALHFTSNLPSPERGRCQCGRGGHLRSSLLVPDGFRMLRFRYRHSGGGSHNAWFMVIAIYMFKCAAAQFLFGLFMAWRVAPPQPAPGLGPAPTWSEDNNCLLLRLPPRPAQTPLDGAGLQMSQTPFNYTLDSVYSARRRK